MKKRPILMSSPMVRALLAGTKTQTRRVVKPQPEHPHFGGRAPFMLAHDDEGIELYLHSSVLPQAIRCPYGRVGDRLWVREAWRSGKIADRFPPRELTPHVVWYEADGTAPEATSGKLRPGMFMPRWACRLELEVVSVRVERLQDISEADAYAEGAPVVALSPQGDYRQLWEQINGPGSWAANPLVWCVSFKKVEPNG